MENHNGKEKPKHDRYNKKFLRGSRGHLRCGDKNVHGGDTTLEPSYAVIALQMLPHAVGFFQKAPPLAAGGKKLKGGKP